MLTDEYESWLASGDYEEWLIALAENGLPWSDEREEDAFDRWAQFARRVS